MRKIKGLHKYIIGFVLRLIIVGSISVYAVTAVIDSREVSYDNETSKGNYDNVQESIDELYRRSGILDKEWTDPILNGADPVFDDTKELIPVTIDDDGTVHYANLYTKWYEYETKRWAKAVILNSTGKGKNYETGDIIAEADIESYFVWIPRYSYKIFNLGNYTKNYQISDLVDQANSTDKNVTMKALSEKEQIIDIVFENNTVSKKSGKAVGEYLTHPAFSLGTTELNGLWVGKFEMTGSIDNITVKPSTVSWTGVSVATFWKTLYSYQKGEAAHNTILDPHMAKNIEWGAIAYLSNSIYGKGSEVNINNYYDSSKHVNKSGYSATTNADQSVYPGISGTDSSVTQPWNTPTGYLASTTGNITGIYDMSGGTWEYVAGYMDGYSEKSLSGVESGFSSEDFKNFGIYFDKYSKDSTSISYNLRIMGDATGEMGPVFIYRDKNNNINNRCWYGETMYFVDSNNPWFARGGGSYIGSLGGPFYSLPTTGYNNNGYSGTRLVLAVK